MSTHDLDRSGHERWWIGAALVAACVLGTITRVEGVLGNPSPLFLWDDAVIHLEVQYLDSIGSATARAREARAEERRSGRDVFRVEDSVAEFRREARGAQPTFGRPLHDLAALAAFESIERAGLPDRSLWAVPLVSALAGALAIPLAFLLARRLWGSTTGARAAAILAASGGHLLYSIEGFSEALLVFFLYLALLVDAHSRAALRQRPDRPLRGSLSLGLVLGAGMLVHFRFAILALVFLVAEALRIRRTVIAKPDALARLFWMGVGIAGMMAIAELPYYVLLMAAKQRGIAVHPKTYLEQVLFVLAPEGLGYAGSLVRFRLDNLLTYPFALVYLCGAVVGVLAVVTLVLDRRSRPAQDETRGAGLLIAVFVAPILFYSVTIPLLRYGATSFALAPLLAARAIGLVEDRLQNARRARLARWVGPLLMGVALFEGGIVPLHRISPDNGYLASVAHAHPPGLQGSAVPPHFTTTPPISWAIAGTDSTRAIPRLESASAADGTVADCFVPYVLVDSLVDFMNIEGQGFPAEERFLRGVEQTHVPRATIPNRFGASLVHDLELNYRPFFETLALHRSREARRADRIRFYVLPSDADTGGERGARP